MIRDIPKPVIAAVNGFAIGGGHVIHVLCDITIAAEHARFGQTGPRVGSFDAGFGSAYLARIVGQKRAREIWMFCRQYDASRPSVGPRELRRPPGRAQLDGAAWADERSPSPHGNKLLIMPWPMRYRAHAAREMAFDSLELFSTRESRAGFTALTKAAVRLLGTLNAATAVISTCDADTARGRRNWLRDGSGGGPSVDSLALVTPTLVLSLGAGRGRDPCRQSTTR